MMVVSFFLFFLKMNEPWANAPSLEHEFMSLKKNLDSINLKKKKKNDRRDNF